MDVMTREDRPASGEELGGRPLVTGRQLRQLLADDAWLDELIDRADDGGVPLTGEGGFLPELVKAVLERGLAQELTDHLGYEKGDPAGMGSPNSRNGTTPKTCRPRSGRSGWTCRGTASRASNRGWCRRASAASAASTT